MACFGVDLYCPESAECAMQCGASDYVCDAAIILSDPDGSYNESLLDVSCEGDCLLMLWWCPEIANTTADCTRTTFLLQTPLNCTAENEHCQIDCNVQNCKFRSINGTLATSLTVDCAGSSCDGSNVICPVGNVSNCTVDCSEETCRFTLIENADGGKLETFTLLCLIDQAYVYI